MVSPGQPSQSSSTQGEPAPNRHAHPPRQQDSAQTLPGSPSDLFASEEGRDILCNEWISRCLSEGKIDSEKLYEPHERSALLGDWLRTLISHGQLDPRRRLPSYASLGGPPFSLREQEVARVIAQLRSEGLLPPRKGRIDKGQPQWTDRDNYCMRWIGHMRAIRYDQAQRLLARLSKYETSDHHMLSISRTSQIIQRWVQARYAVYRRVYAKQPGWIYLTRQGLYHAGLHYRAEPPKDRVLEHIYYVNEVRLMLEEQTPSQQWISERAIQAAQEMRQKGQRLQHIPDGILVIGEKRIDIEVQLSRPSQQEVVLVMRGDPWRGANALRYYVGRDAWAVVQRAYSEVKTTARPQIEIIELAKCLMSSTKGESQ